ncbi:uncharacterized protein LOC130791819 [Actinidia eriantha]|uniref:uncharacterized protein LOC130791819 n=1 Tax=Actinidia eriantha TaxID=165200 RepID=UPI00258A55C7|nr:uncharacterized protein LOC130791819 [Actinidia eriantha]
MRGSGEPTKGRWPGTGRRARGMEEEAVELDAVGEDEVGVAVRKGVGELDEEVVVGPKVGGAGCEGGDQMEAPVFLALVETFRVELDFKDNYFDFVFSRALDKVSFPALLVLEIEHVLQPGGTSAMLVGASSFYSGGLIRSATPVSSFLKSSSVVHVCGIRSLTLVIFKKRFDNVAFFQHYRLPSECLSITNNKRFIEFMEPLDENSGPIEMKLSYLPEFMNISSRNRFIYINIGAGELVNSSISEMFKPFYPMEPRAFNNYVVDHNTSVLSSYVKNPIVTFVYHPGLAGGQGYYQSQL